MLEKFDSENILSPFFSCDKTIFIVLIKYKFRVRKEKEERETTWP